MKTPASAITFVSCCIFACFAIAAEPSADRVAADSAQVQFARDVAPILSEHCVRCHNPSNPQGDVSLSQVDDLRDNEFLSPGDPDSSYLLQLVSSSDGQPPEMPKDADPLTDQQLAVLRKWIDQGAEWPEDVELHAAARADRSWWSLQPLRATGDASIDPFIEKRLEQESLSLRPPADRRTLIRRATYDLTGLPPTPQEVEAFENDADPQAYEKLIDRLLASPHYGERWGRHWLDVVRFGESNGYERNVLIDSIWPFRDYVIRSINEDKPFDQFIREHLAGDVFSPSDPGAAVGTAFLVAGPYDDVGNSDPVQAAQIRANTLDEIIRATGEAFLGLTVGCARCHDHKFDPIQMRDYYSLYSIFSGIRHGAVPLGTAETQQTREAQLGPLESQRNSLQKSIQDLKAAILQRGQQRLDHHAQSWNRPAVDRRGTEEIFAPVEAKYVRLVCEARDSSLRASSGFGVDEFEVWSKPADEGVSRNVALAEAGAKASGASRHIEDFKDAYSARLAIDGQFGARFIAAGPDLTIELAAPTTIYRVCFSSARDAEKPEQGKFSFVAEYRIEVSLDGETWREVAHGRDRKPTEHTSDPSHLEYRLAKLETTADDALQLETLTQEVRKLDAEITQIPDLPSVWIGTRNAKDAQGPFHVYLGGSPQKKGNPVVPASLAVLRDSQRADFAFELSDDANESQRREALARWITHPSNPLTPRVLANRLWHYHFGQGIVNTPNDFGYMGGAPSHPELLDHLAAQLIAHDWKLKPLHRQIMLSRTYRQSSVFHGDAAKIDRDARLLWRFPPRRLSAEEIRDTILLIAGKLEKLPEGFDLSVPDGGPGFRLYHFMQDNVCTYVPLDKHGPETYRRAVYHQNARASVVDFLTDFDQPDCTLSAPKRAQTTTPLQALTSLNHQFTLDMARALTERVQHEAQPSTVAQVQYLFQLCYGRAATADDVAACQAIVEAHGLTALCRAILNTSELIYVR